jgi:hypothetical protein
MLDLILSVIIPTSFVGFSAYIVAAHWHPFIKRELHQDYYNACFWLIIYAALLWMLMQINTQFLNNNSLLHGIPPDIWSAFVYTLYAVLTFGELFCIYMYVSRVYIDNDPEKLERERKEAEARRRIEDAEREKQAAIAEAAAAEAQREAQEKINWREHVRSHTDINAQINRAKKQAKLNEWGLPDEENETTDYLWAEYERLTGKIATDRADGKNVSSPLRDLADIQAILARRGK